MGCREPLRSEASRESLASPRGHLPIRPAWAPHGRPSPSRRGFWRLAREVAGRVSPVAVAACLLGCGDADPGDAGRRPLLFGEFSADAKLDTFAELQLDLDAPRHASDGGGRAWLEAVETSRDGRTFAPALRDSDGAAIVYAGQPARFRIVFEAGPLGIAPGGVLFLQASPFWDWDPPQTIYADGPGYTEVTTSAPEVQLSIDPVASQLLAIAIEGGPLQPGARIGIHYGAGPAGTRVDRYAERESKLFIAVDGDADGVRALIDDSPSVRVVAGPAAQLVLTLPSTARPGDPLRLTAAVLDRLGNAGVDFEGVVSFVDPPEGLELPERIVFEPEHRGRRRVAVRALEGGIYRLRGRVDGQLSDFEAESNPLVVGDRVPKILWADLHGHSNLSDGTGTPDDYFEYARDIAALDVIALTDHDHWGMRFLDTTPELWQRIRQAVKRFHRPGEFVTLLGYEWTSWLQGHRHVLYFRDPSDPGAEILSSLDPRYQTPDQLWSALSGRAALTFAHHSAGGPISTNWRFAPPPELEPITEVASVHGSSEALDSPRLIYDPVPGNTVRDALKLGYQFGFIGSGDGHDGHPGLAGLATSDGAAGLAAIIGAQHTRASVLAALRARQTYATNGPRIYLAVRLQDTSLDFEVAATAPVASIDFIRSGLTASMAGEGERDLAGQRTIPQLAAGEYLYLRVVQEDGGAAWSSPFYGDAE